MQIAQSQENLYDVETWDVLADAAIFFDESKELSSRAVLDDKDKTLFTLEGETHIYKEGVSGGLHDIALVHYNILFLIFDDYFLVDDFHSIESTIPSKPAKKYLWKPTWSNQFE